MSDHPFLRFISLVTFDQKVQSLENEKIAVDAEIVTLQKQKEDFQHTLDEMRKRVVQLKKKVDEQELEMKVLDQKEKDKKQRLEHLSDYKEYQAIKAEVEAVQRLQVEQEQVVLDAWSQLENAQYHVNKKITESTQQIMQFDERIQLSEQKAIALRSTMSTMGAERAEKEQGVPAEWLEKYVLMHSRVKDPVVEIFHQSCGVCSHMITAQEMIRARHGALVQCQQCYRLLYAPEMMEKHAL